MKTFLTQLTAAALLTCQSHAASTAQFEQAQYDVNEVQGSLTLLVTRTKPFTTNPSVRVVVEEGTAKEGEDFKVSTNLIINPSGNALMWITLNDLDDGVHEEDETVTLALADPSGGVELGSPSKTTITIHNGRPTVELKFGDLPPDYYGDPVVHETVGGSVLPIRLLRRGDTNTAFTVEFEVGTDSTATLGQDYLLPSPVTFNAGEREKQVNLIILDDGEVELNEFIHLQLASSNDAVAIMPFLLNDGSSNRVWIIDNEIPASIDFHTPFPDARLWLGYKHSFDMWRKALLPGGGFLGPTILPGVPLARFDSRGRLAGVFPKLEEIDGFLSGFVPLDDGGVLISGNCGLARLLPDGSLDHTFVPPTDGSIDPTFRASEPSDPFYPLQISILAKVRALIDWKFLGIALVSLHEHMQRLILLTPEGKIYVIEAEKSGTTDFRQMRLVRLRPDGSPDESFMPFYPDRGVVEFLALCPDGGVAIFQWGERILLLDSAGHPRPAYEQAALSSYCAGGSVNFIQIAPDRVAVASTCAYDVNGVRSPVLRLTGSPRSGFQTFATNSPSVDRYPGPLGNPWKAVAERDAQSVQIVVRRLGETKLPAIIRYHTRDGTARAGEHYVAMDGLLEFAALETTKRIVIQLLRTDTERRFSLELFDAVAAEVLGPPMEIVMPGNPAEYRLAVEKLQDGHVLVADPNLTFPPEGPVPEYNLESSSDLKSWKKLGRPTWIEPRDSSAPQRFYRAVAQ